MVYTTYLWWWLGDGLWYCFYPHYYSWFLHHPKALGMGWKLRKHRQRVPWRKRLKRTVDRPRHSSGYRSPPRRVASWFRCHQTSKNWVVVEPLICRIGNWDHYPYQKPKLVSCIGVKPPNGIHIVIEVGCGLKKIGFTRWLKYYPLVNVYITMENHHVING